MQRFHIRLVCGQNMARVSLQLRLFLYSEKLIANSDTMQLCIFIEIAVLIKFKLYKRQFQIIPTQKIEDMPEPMLLREHFPTFEVNTKYYRKVFSAYLHNMYKATFVHSSSTFNSRTKCYKFICVHL